MPEPASPEREFLVVCLCADWCGTCRDYRAPFEALGKELPDAEFLWVDIEDEGDWAATARAITAKLPSIHGGIQVVPALLLPGASRKQQAVEDASSGRRHAGSWTCVRAPVGRGAGWPVRSVFRFCSPTCIPIAAACATCRSIPSP